MRTLILCACTCLACMVFVGLVWMFSWPRPKRRAKDKRRRSIGTMDIILIIVGVALAAFTIEMIYIFRTYGTEPSTLETCVFSTLGGECGVMGWIQTTKQKNKEREWQKEDEQLAESGSLSTVDHPMNNL